MPARRDTRIEAPKVRRLSPLQTFEDQSQTWGIRCHSCTGREGLPPSWKLSYKTYVLRFTRALLLDSGVLSSNVVREVQCFFKVIEKQWLQGRKGDKNEVGQPQHIHAPGIQQEPRAERIGLRASLNR